jgi:two-component system invasion response regulator UvrY
MINIGIVDDHAVVRAGLREFLNGYEDLCVVGEAASGRGAIDLVRSVEMDVMVLDLMMKGQSGQDALAYIRTKAPEVAVLIFSGYPEEIYAAILMRQGASGYLQKDCAPDALVDAIRTVAKGRHFVTEAVTERLACLPVEAVDAPPHEQLSVREFQVFLKLARGQERHSICRELSLSTKTVSSYRTKLLRKMRLDSNAELAYYALTNGLLE